MIQLKRHGLLSLISLLFCTALYAKNQIVNIYSWSNYIPNKVIKEFEKETHIHINYTSYDENETLYTKLKADPKIDYDIVFPSSYYVQRMAQENMLQKLDLTRLANIKNINPLLLNRSYDPGNQYSVPYLWGTSSLIVNAHFFDPNSIHQWSDLWQPRFKNQLVLLNDIRDVFAVALISLGYSINTDNPKQIKAAYLKLKLLLPNVKLFNTEALIPIYSDEDAGIGMIFNGDAAQVIQENPATHYIYPKDGVIVWIDCASIPKYAPHLANAYQFINFLMRPDIASQISMSLNYSTPNLGALKLLPASMRNNPVINPPKEVLEHAQIENYINNNVSRLYSYYWNLLKLSS